MLSTEADKVRLQLYITTEALLRRGGDYTSINLASVVATASKRPSQQDFSGNDCILTLSASVETTCVLICGGKLKGRLLSRHEMSGKQKEGMNVCEI